MVETSAVRTAWPNRVALPLPCTVNLDTALTLSLGIHPETSAMEMRTGSKRVCCQIGKQSHIRLLASKQETGNYDKHADFHQVDFEPMMG